jgi:phosphoribosylformylglycinamidine synthase
MGQIDDVSRCVTMDFKQTGNLIYLVGETRDEMGGSHFALVNGISGGHVPIVKPETAQRTFAALHRAIESGQVRACHDLCEGGLAVAVAEMAFAGGLGAIIDVAAVEAEDRSLNDATRMFSESNTRFLCEVEREKADAFEAILSGITVARIGQVASENQLKLRRGTTDLVDTDIQELKEAWQAPLRW